MATRVLTTRREVEAFNKELQGCGAAFDTEWYQYDRKRHNCENGLAFCATFCYQDRFEELQSVYVHNYGESDGNLWALKGWFEAEDNFKIGHNVPADYHIVKNHGIGLGGTFIDTMVADYLYDERRENNHTIGDCMRDHLGTPRLDFAETFGVVKKKKDGTEYASGQRDVPSLEDVVKEPGGFDKIVEYALHDAEDAWNLHLFYKQKLTAIPWGARNYWDYFIEHECTLTRIICEMERRGMYIDRSFLHSQAKRAAEDLKATEEAVARWCNAPINIGSDKQLGQLFHGKGQQPVYKGKKVLYYIPGLGLPVLEQTPTGNPKVDASTIKRLAKLPQVKNDPHLVQLFDLIRNHSAIATQKGTFLDGISAKMTPRSNIHCRFNQIGTTSGRASASGPNLQNISTGDKDTYHLRDCFAAPPGFLMVVADFSQLEYRLLAHLSQDPKLLETFRNDLDMHSLTTYNVYEHVRRTTDAEFGELDKLAVPEKVLALKAIAQRYENERKFAKILNFEIIYGVGPKKLSEQLGIHKDEAWGMIKDWFRGYPGVRQWQDRCLGEFRTKGFCRTLYGRPRRANLRMLNHELRAFRGQEERTLLNALVQGSAADVCERAMVKIAANAELKNLGYAMTMQVHDEVVGIAPLAKATAAQKILEEIMPHPFAKPLRVPLPVSVGVGPSWATAKH